MLTMDKIHDIRFRFFKKGECISQIANVLQMNRKTVKKYVDKMDFNEPAPKAHQKNVFVPSWILINQQLINGLKKTSRHHVSNVIPPGEYFTALKRKY